MKIIDICIKKNNFFNITYIRTSFWLILSSASTEGLAAPPPTEFANWNQVLAGKSLVLIDDVNSQIPNILFDAIHSLDFTVFKNSHFSMDVSIQRDVYNNQDLRGTWTVMDQLGIGGTIPILSLATSLIGPGGTLGFSIGAKAGVNLFEIRQVLPTEYEALDSAEERVKNIQNDAQFQNFLKYRDEARVVTTEEGIQGQWIESLDESGSVIRSFFSLTSQNYARFSKFWNFALIPFKLPLTINAFERLNRHQILSYSGYGGVELGMSVGWTIDPTALTGIASLGASASILMRGDYRISVMKEDTSIARVKLSRSVTSAEGKSIGAAETPGLLNNVIIVNVVNQVLEIIPFQLSDTNTQQLFIDIGYRYNLGHPGGREAYENAVLGKFALSDRLSLREDGSIRTDLSETGVIREFLRTGSLSGEDEETKLKFAFIFKKNRLGTVTDVKTKITLPDGTHNIFTGMIKNDSQWSLFWSQYEKFQRNFLINLDLDLHASSFPMTIEGKIDDTHTTQSELRRYVLEIENAVGIPFLFPRTPLIMQPDYWSSSLSPRNMFSEDKELGHSTFYYQLNLTDVQVQKFIDTPAEKMWEHLERAFHITPGKWSSATARFFYELFRSPLITLEYPLSLLQIDIKPGMNIIHAKSIYKKWLAVREHKTVTERIKAMSYLFMDPVFSEELTYLVRDVLDGEEVGYYVNAYHPVIGGKIVRQGGTQVNFEDVASQKSRQFDFDVAGANLVLMQPSLGVERFSVDASIPKQVTLSFNLEQKPNYIYLDLALENPFPRNFHNKVLGAIILKNAGQFNAGENTITLNTEMENGRYLEMINHLQSQQDYKMTAAISLEENKWGPAAETRFRMP